MAAYVGRAVVTVTRMVEHIDVFWFIFAVAILNLGVGFGVAVLANREDDTLDLIAETPGPKPPATVEPSEESCSESAQGPTEESCSEPAEAPASGIDDASLADTTLAELEALIGGMDQMAASSQEEQ